MSQLKHAVRSFVTDDEGATMVEYGIMVALIAAVCIGIITTLGGSVQTVFSNINTAITAA